MKDWMTVNVEVERISGDVFGKHVKSVGPEERNRNLTKEKCQSFVQKMLLVQRYAMDKKRAKTATVYGTTQGREGTLQRHGRGCACVGRDFQKGSTAQTLCRGKGD